jgi:polysaccharide biosynthesis protein PslH
MRILYVAHRVPYPPNKGDKIRSFHEIRFLSRGHEVDLLAFYDDPSDANHKPHLDSFCRSVTLLPLFRRLQTARAMAAMVSGKPATLGYYASAAMSEAVRRVFSQRQPDAAVAFSSSVAPYVEALPTRRVLDFVDSDASKWRQYAKSVGFPRNLLYRLEARRLCAFELSMMRRFDASVFVAPRELAWLDGRTGEQWLRSSVHFISNGVDLEYFAPSLETPADPDIVFTGAMDYFPNVDGVQNFADSVLPIIRAQLPQARFIIVGSNPVAAVRALQRRPGIVVTGPVPDIRPYLHHARVAVVPLRISRGLQNKVLEALAAGLSVVTTPEVAGGLPDIGGLPLYVEKDPPSMAGRILEQLRAPKPSLERAVEIRQVLREKCSWENNLRPFESLLHACSTGGPRNAGREG